MKAPRPQYPPHVPQNYDQQEFDRWRGRNHMTHQVNYSDQRLFLNSIPVNSYLRQTGFDAKKVMWAMRMYQFANHQWQVMVTINKSEYLRVDHGPRNCLKVGGVVFPLLQPELSHERVYEQIVAEKIPGNYLYWQVMGLKLPDDTIETNRGPLFNVQIIRTTEPNDPIINYGMTAGVYPYYTDEKGYVPYLEFNRNDTGFKPYQNRFTATERERGIYELNTLFGLRRLYSSARIRARVKTSPHPVNHLSAIYVPNNVTLIVCATNTGFSNTKQRDPPLQGNAFHERWVIQAGGLVVLLNYTLYYQFMNDENGNEFRFQDQNSYANEASVHTQDNFADMRNLINKVNYPLIVLGEPNQGNRPVRHYAGYSLEIKNHDQYKRAVLQIPLGGTFREVHELDIPPQLRNQKNPPVEGVDFMDTEWEDPNEPYRRYTGPYEDADDIDWNQTAPYPV